MANKLDLNLYHDIQRRNIDAKLLEYTTEKRDNGNYYRKFNYMSGEVGELFKKIYANYKAIGFTEHEAKLEIINKSTIYKIDTKDYLEGKKPIPAFHLFEILKVAGIKLDGTLEKEVHTSEAFGNTLVLTRNFYPKFHININTAEGDYYDFEIEYNSKHDVISSKKLTSMLMIMFRWYFGKKSPYARPKVYEKIQSLYYTGKLELIKK